jgi:uroporphyrinogen decarboxylase
MERSENCLKKLKRMNDALNHREPDRVPISDFFWGSFIERWKKDLDLPAESDIYTYYDLDWQVTLPNMDPHIKTFEIIEEDSESITVRTGFEAVIRKNFADPMPAFLKFETDSIDKLNSFQFDDPYDQRRYFSPGDNQIAGVGDGFARNSPAWTESVRKIHPDFPVYGSVCEGHEMLWRIIGSENVMTWMLMYPVEFSMFMERLGSFITGLTRGQIEAADGMLDGMVIWGDVAYGRDLLFDPESWRRYFKPIVKQITDICHGHNIPVIYHGCGNSKRIFDDYIEIGIDAYNPLESKAGMDVIKLRREFGHKIGFCGNLDVLTWANGSREEIKNMVLEKLNAAKGGGYIVQSDHSVPGNISGQNYEYVVNLVREYGNYPLELDEYDIPDLSRI